MKTRQPLDFAILASVAVVVTVCFGFGPSTAQDAPPRALPKAPSAPADDEAEVDKWVPPEDIVRKAFESPPGAKPISKEHLVWIDRKQGRVYVDGYVAMQDGPLEMFACPI